MVRFMVRFPYQCCDDDSITAIVGVHEDLRVSFSFGAGGHQIFAIKKKIAKNANMRRGEKMLF